jgi:hypothetical protein
MTRIVFAGEAEDFFMRIGLPVRASDVAPVRIAAAAVVDLTRARQPNPRGRGDIEPDEATHMRSMAA